jgi:hypothetical protein
MANELEKAVEKYLREQMNEIGGLCYKWVSPGRKGVPDRICIFPPFAKGSTGTVFFIEVKRPGEEPSGPQKREMERLVEKGQLVAIIDSKKGVDQLIAKYQEIKNGILAEVERNKSNTEQKQESRIIKPGDRGFNIPPNS